MSLKAIKPGGGRAPDPGKAYRQNYRQMALRRKIYAYRLAASDFFYAIDPSMTAYLLNIPEEDAKKARKLPQYEQHLQDLIDENKGQLKRSMKEDTEKLRLSLQAKVPRALEVLDIALYGDDATVALRAAQEVLDRDGRMPKVSRLQTTPVDEGAMPDVEPKLLAEFLPTSKPN